MAGPSENVTQRAAGRKRLLDVADESFEAELELARDEIDHAA
jgi:hypothetical protein